MVARRKTGLIDPVPILADMKACRDTMIEVQKRHDRRSAIFREANALMRSIDDLGLLITGEADVFLTPRHSTPARRGD